MPRKGDTHTSAAPLARTRGAAFFLVDNTYIDIGQKNTILGEKASKTLVCAQTIAYLCIVFVRMLFH